MHSFYPGMPPVTRPKEEDHLEIIKGLRAKTLYQFYNFLIEHNMASRVITSNKTFLVNLSL